MKKRVIVVFAVVILAVAAYLIVNPGAIPGRAASGTPGAAGVSTLAPVKAIGQVNVEGKLVPYQYVDLTFATSGTVEAVLVAEGQSVKKGDVLARLRNQEQIKVSVTSARLDVANAQKALNDLYINAPLQAAQIWSDMTQAQKDLDDSQKKRTALDYPRADETILKEDQQTYDSALDGYNQMKDYYDRANESDKRNLLDRLQKFRKERDDALAQLNYDKGKPDQFQFDQADAKLALAKAKLQDMQRKYTILQNGPDPDEVSVAQAQLAQAQAKAEAAQASLNDLELTAPFNGTVVSLSLKPGQSVGQDAQAVTLADFSKWRVETTNLTELSVLKIKVGSPASVSFDALPGVNFNGKVAAISSLGQNQVETSPTPPRSTWKPSIRACVGT
jgi:HlyD family secretion protein